jgi:hypothetical protein
MKVSHIFMFNGISTQETLVSNMNLHQMHGSTVVYMHYSYSSDLLKSSSLLNFNPLYKILSTTFAMSLTNNHWRSRGRRATVSENIQENTPSMMQKTFLLRLSFAPLNPEHQQPSRLLR